MHIAQSSIEQKARVRIRKYRFVSLSFAVLITAALMLTLNIIDEISLIVIPIILFAYWLLQRSNRYFYNKYINSAIFKEQDAKLYLSMISQGKFDSNNGSITIAAEYCCGNYGKIISICTKKLSDPKRQKRQSIII